MRADYRDTDDLSKGALMAIERVLLAFALYDSEATIIAGQDRDDPDYYD